MSFTPANPTGWSPYEPVTADQLNHLDDQLVQAVDGVGGGSYSGPLEFTNVTGLGGTYDLDMTGDVTVTGSITATEDITCRDIYCDEINTTVGITATSPTTNITMMGGLITTGGGTLSSQGGTITTQGGPITTNGGGINMGGGTITTANGAINMGTGNLTCSSITTATTTYTDNHTLAPLWMSNALAYEVILEARGLVGVLQPGISNKVGFLIKIPSNSTLTRILISISAQTAQNPADTVIGPLFQLKSQLVDGTVAESLLGQATDITCTTPYGVYNIAHTVELFPGTPVANPTPTKYMTLQIQAPPGSDANALVIHGIRSDFTRTTACLGGV